MGLAPNPLDGILDGIINSEQPVVRYTDNPADDGNAAGRADARDDREQIKRTPHEISRNCPCSVCDDWFRKHADQDED